VSIQTIILAAFLLLLFLTVFFLNLFRYLRKRKAAIQDSLQAVSLQEYSCEATDVEYIQAGIVSLFWRPFTRFSDNPELLPVEESPVIYERNGIHYINDTLSVDKNTLDNGFANLVESVIGKVQTTR
jgi:hypothetical protein